MNDESIMYLRKGLEIAENCLGECYKLRIELTITAPNLEIMNTLLAKDYLKFCFNGQEPDDDIFIFHNSKDKYSHNGDIKIVCFLSQTPKVLKHVRRHKKVSSLIKELKQRKEVKK